MDKENRIVGVFACSSMASTWTEYLCMTSSADGSVTLVSRSHEVLGSEETLDSQDVIWPDGVDPDDECEERPWPASIDGKEVVACEDGIYLGAKLFRHSDESTATFPPNDWKKAQRWIETYYREAGATVDAQMLRKIERAFRDRTGIVG